MTAAAQADYRGHRQRLRARFARAGAAGLHDYELVELLLTFAIPRRDVKPLAKALLARFGSLRGVADAQRHELLAVPGLGPGAATLLCLLKELTAAYLNEQMCARPVVAGGGAVAAFARARLGGLGHEAIMAIYLNAVAEVLDCRMLQEGTIDQAVIHPRRLVEQALACKAASLVLVHNHPSGRVQPSAGDLKLTHQVAQIAAPLDLVLQDHLIVSAQDYYSFAEHGLLPRPRTTG